jgi:hypothetical protein
MSTYPYIVPPGMGDSFYIYAVNGEDIPVADGNSYSLLGVTVEDADFIWRAWSGAALLLGDGGTVQIYDGARNAFFQLPILSGGIFPPAMAILPEKRFRNNTSLRFDLTNVELNTNSNGTANVYADQMAWYGVKRSPGGIKDPGPSNYRYYEKPFSYPFSFNLTNYGPSGAGGVAIPGLAVPAHYTQLVTDYDFELRRILVTVGAGGGTIQFAVEGSGVISITGMAGLSVGLVSNFGTPNQSFSVTLVGSQITVLPATDALGNVTTTSAQAVSLINSSGVAGLITASLIAGGSYPGSSNYFTIPGGGGGSAYASPFKILLYDAAWRGRTSIPILSELICTSVSTIPPASTMPNNAWPCPPLLYPVNSVIRFDIFSLIPTGDTLPVSVNLLFDGVRRVAC